MGSAASWAAFGGAQPAQLLRVRVGEQLFKELSGDGLLC